MDEANEQFPPEIPSDDHRNQEERRTVRRRKENPTRRREYRERQTSEERRKTKAAATAYKREYRARKRKEKESQQPTDPIPGTSTKKMTSTESTDSNDRLHHQRIKQARNSRNYRIRKREARAAIANATATIQSTSNNDHSLDQESSLSHPTFATVAYDSSLPDVQARRKFREKFVDNRAGVVAIYQNQNTAHITTPHMEIEYCQTTSISVTSRAIGDLCATESVLPNEQKIITVVVYISPNQRLADIIKFLHFNLLPYTPVGAAKLGETYDKMPLILGGEFNMNFLTDEAETLIVFLNDKLNLKMNTDRNISTTVSRKTTDAVFSRYLEDIQSQIYIPYFSYHKPIVTFLQEVEEQ